MARFPSKPAPVAAPAKALTAIAPLLALLAPAGPARADFYLHHWANEHEGHRDLRLVVSAGYYETRENFDAVGARFEPAGLDKYGRIQTDVFGAYGLTKRFSVFGRLGWARAQLDSSAPAAPAGNTFGFTDSTLGVSARAFELPSDGRLGGLTADIQLQGDFPLYSNRNLSGPALGDGTVDVTAGAFLSLPVVASRSAELRLTGGAGFTYRSDGRSSAIPWSFAAEYAPRQQGVFASVAGVGFESLRNDTRASAFDAATPAISIAPGTGGSFASGALNPSLAALRAEAGYQFGPDVAASAFASQSLAGQNAPSGFNVGFSLRTRVGNHQKAVDGAHLSPMDYGRANQGFVNYSTEARVTRVNDRLNLVKLDKGTQDGIETGQVFDVFLVRKDGNVGEAIARGRVSSAKLNESALTIDEYFKEIWIDEGFIAKRPVD